MTHSQATETIKKVLKLQIEAKALLFNKKWQIEVEPNGKIDGQYSSQYLASDSFHRVVDKYFGFLKRKEVDLIDAYLINKPLFPESYLDITMEYEIQEISEYLREHFPEKLI